MQHGFRSLQREITPRCRAAVYLSLLFSSLLVVGCGGPDVVSVQGKVTLEGKPLPNALVSFSVVSGGGRGAAARTDGQGYYELHYNDTLDGITPGLYKVQITTRNPEGIPGPGNRDLVPSKYNTETELQVKIDKTNKNLNFELDR